MTKFEKVKGSKKDKEKREAEDELERARDRLYALIPCLYARHSLILTHSEEAEEEVRDKMHIIQDNEKRTRGNNQSKSSRSWKTQMLDEQLQCKIWELPPQATDGMAGKLSLCLQTCKEVGHCYA